MGDGVNDERTRRLVDRVALAAYCVGLLTGALIVKFLG